MNYDSSWDEWVGPDRRRPYQPPQFAAGDKVQVRWEVDKKWYPATVREGWYGLHFVRYDGYTASADEWVGPDSIRLQGRMNRMSACPDDRMLIDALLGISSQSDLNRIEAHLVECSSCLERSRRLSISDSWVDLVHRQKSMGRAEELTEYAAELMARLRSFSTSDVAQESVSKARTDATVRQSPQPPRQTKTTNPL